MTPEERKNYNKIYYEHNKEIILAKSCAKVQCELCSRIVNNNRLNYHMQTNLCANAENNRKMIEDRKKMKTTDLLRDV